MKQLKSISAILLAVVAIGVAVWSCTKSEQIAEADNAVAMELDIPTVVVTALAIENE